MARKRHLSVSIVGAGRVGSVLGRILVENGERVVAVVSRRRGPAQRAARFLRCRIASTKLSAIPRETDLILIATPHAAVEEVAAGIAALDTLRFRSLSVCHASGMLTADVLEPIRLRGATVFSFHPLQTFPRDFAPAEIMESARGISYGVDGSPKAVRMARQLAAKLEGRVVEIPTAMRAYYHASCVVASNHLTTVFSILEEMARAMNVKGSTFYAMFNPIVTATLRNIEKTSPARALSGPVARGGVETVGRHFESLARYSPSLIPYFARMSLETVKLALSKGSIDDAQARALTDVIRSYMDTPSQVMH